MIDKEEKIRRITALKEYQREIFKSINVDYNTVQYIPRMAYKPTGYHEISITLFSSELRGEQDIYTEFVNKVYESEDAHRILYKWKYNAFWNTEYATSEDTIPNSVKYYIPVSELVVIGKDGVVRDDKNETEIETPKSIKSTDLSAMLKKKEDTGKEKDAYQKSELDIPIKDLTLRQIIQILNKLT